MKLFSLVTLILLPALISAKRENCVSEGTECGLLRCCPGFDCDANTGKCVKEKPKKFCMIMGPKCGPNIKKCCPDTYCDSETGKCELEP